MPPNDYSLSAPSSPLPAHAAFGTKGSAGRTTSPGQHIRSNSNSIGLSSASHSSSGSSSTATSQSSTQQQLQQWQMHGTAARPRRSASGAPSPSRIYSSVQAKISSFRRTQTSATLMYGLVTLVLLAVLAAPHMHRHHNASVGVIDGELRTVRRRLDLQRSALVDLAGGGAAGKDSSKLHGLQSSGKQAAAGVLKGGQGLVLRFDDSDSSQDTHATVHGAGSGSSGAVSGSGSVRIGILHENASGAHPSSSSSVSSTGQQQTQASLANTVAAMFRKAATHKLAQGEKSQQHATLAHSGSHVQHSRALSSGQKEAVQAYIAAARNRSTGAVRLKHPIWWAAPFQSVSGYGQEAISYGLGLLEAGLLQPEDLWLSQSGDSLAGAAVANMEAGTRAFVQLQMHAVLQQVLPAADFERQAVVVCHSFPDCWLRPGETNYMGLVGCPCPLPEMESRYTYKIGRSMFETNVLPPHLVLHAQQFDEIWVPSEFNRQSFQASGVSADKLFILPEGINTSIFDPGLHTPLALPSIGALRITGNATVKGDPPAYVFLSVFKWEQRKGHQFLLSAFVNEFMGRDDVELHIVTRPFMEGVSSWEHKVHREIMDHAGLPDPINWTHLPRIYVHTGYISDHDYPRIYKAADCLVVPTRGEGWGRPQMEAMAMGLPVITTNWSGLTAFVHEDVAYPLKVEAIEPAVSDGPSFFAYFKGSSWAKPSETHLRQLMRHVFTHQEEAKAKGQAARSYVLRDFSPAAIASQLYAHISRVQQKLDGGGDVAKLKRDEKQQHQKGLKQQQQQQQQQQDQQTEQQWQHPRHEKGEVAGHLSEVRVRNQHGTYVLHGRTQHPAHKDGKHGEQGSAPTLQHAHRVLDPRRSSSTIHSAATQHVVGLGESTADSTGDVVEGEESIVMPVAGSIDAVLLGPLEMEGVSGQ